MFSVVFGVVNLVKCQIKLVQSAFGCTIISPITYLLTYLLDIVKGTKEDRTQVYCLNVQLYTTAEQLNKILSPYD